MHEVTSSDLKLIVALHPVVLNIFLMYGKVRIGSNNAISTNLRSSGEWGRVNMIFSEDLAVDMN